MDAEASITCTVEVKRHVVKQSLRQAQTQFVCASLKSSLPVISILTDMTSVEYYTTGEQAPDGWIIITQRFFATARVMMQFPGAAMRSAQPDHKVAAHKFVATTYGWKIGCGRFDFN